MLDPIPIIFVATALVGIIVIAVRHLPEFKEIQGIQERHSTISGAMSRTSSRIGLFTFGGFLNSLWRKFAFVGRQLYKAVLFAKSEVKNSYDLTRHLSFSVKHRFEKKRIQVQVDKNEESAASDADLHKAEALFEQGQHLQAEETIIALLKSQPTFKPTYELLAEVYMARGSFMEAAEVFRYLIKQHQGNEQYWRGLGAALSGLADYKEAIKAYLKSLEVYSNPEIFISLGLAYQALGDNGSAGKAFESALDLDPENTQVLMLLSDNLLSRNEHQAAKGLLEQIIELEPRNAVAR